MEFRPSLLALALAFVLNSVAVTAAPFKVREISKISNSNSVPKNINSKGQVCGYQTSGIGGVWNTEGIVSHTIPALPGYRVNRVWAMNDHGQAVGSSYESLHNATYAFTWSVKTGIVPVIPLPGYIYCDATDINNLGQIVGYCYNPAPPYQMYVPFVWTPGIGMVQLPNPPGFLSSRARSINDHGVVVGDAFFWGSGLTSTAERHAMLWYPDGTTVDLGKLAGCKVSHAESINNNGVVVGCAQIQSATATTQGVIWKPNGEIISLGLLPGGDTRTRGYSHAYDVNDLDEVVGASFDRTSTRSFYWSAQTGMQELTASGWTGYAYSINNKTQITGVVKDASRVERVVIWESNAPANRPPDVSTAVAGITEIWPPYRQFVPISILGVTDPDGDPVTITITSILQDEPVKGNGHGNWSPDAIPTATSDVIALRAERNAKGNGRVYEIKFVADDGKGGVSDGVVYVGVPRDMSKNRKIINDGCRYDSTAK